MRARSKSWNLDVKMAVISDLANLLKEYRTTIQSSAPSGSVCRKTREGHSATLLMWQRIAWWTAMQSGNTRVLSRQCRISSTLTNSFSIFIIEELANPINVTATKTIKLRIQCKWCIPLWRATTSNDRGNDWEPARTCSEKFCFVLGRLHKRTSVCNLPTPQTIRRIVFLGKLIYQSESANLRTFWLHTLGKLVSSHTS